jgi:hypothetical protein
MGVGCCRKLANELALLEEGMDAMDAIEVVDVLCGMAIPD